mmetsp:Transcript_33295/g.74857  ORF Transcript_33295/g.74857 Transcript_33295/m.74857 type:complete len:224 (+) Transcript_33295:481-1152(+)
MLHHHPVGLFLKSIVLRHDVLDGIKNFGQARALRVVLHQHLHNQIVRPCPRRRDVGVAPGIVLKDLGRDLLQRPCKEGWVVLVEQLVQNHAQGPHVPCCSLHGSRATVDLWGHVNGRSMLPTLRTLGVTNQTKVDDGRIAMLADAVQHDVGRLQVGVHQAHLVVKDRGALHDIMEDCKDVRSAVGRVQFFPRLPAGVGGHAGSALLTGMNELEQIASVHVWHH